jgi:hypothetical protein
VLGTTAATWAGLIGSNIPESSARRERAIRTGETE